MPSTYDPTLASSIALHWVRWKVGDTKQDRPLADDGEIAAALAEHDLLITSNPLTNMRPALLAAAKVADGIAASLASKSEIVMTGVGQVKSNASQLYRDLARTLRSQANRQVAPSWQNHEAYPTTHVFGEDPLPSAIGSGGTRTLDQSP